jgi:acetyl esterase/lipase
MHKRWVMLLLLALLAPWMTVKAAERDALPASRLANLPDSWFLQHVGGKRVVVDGHTLDLRVQYLLSRYSKADRKKPGAPTVATAQGRATIRKMADREWLLTTKTPPGMASVTDYEVPARGGAIHVREYHPRVAGELPIIVYFHGGGWFFGSVAASDRSNQLLAAEARMIVVAVDYRLAPDFPYPAAWNDAQDAYAWVAKEASHLGGSPADICVGGDSAGADLSIAVTRRRQAAGESAPVCQLLYYPAPDDRTVDAMRSTYRSARLFGEGFGLDRSFMDYVLPAVFQHRNRRDPEISPLFAKSAGDLPPTFYAIAFFDPLRDSQRAYAARLVRAGDEVTFWEFPTLAHGFLQMTAVSPAAQFAATQTAKAFGAFARDAAVEDAQLKSP